MSKRRPALDPSQLGFTFEPPPAARLPADLAGLDRVIASAVGQALKDDVRSRHAIAAAMSELLDESVTAMMLDAYASEARDNHNVSMHRFLALIAVTERFDLLDHVTRRIGAALLVGEEIHAARLGHLRAQRKRIDAEIKAAEGAAQEITRGRDK
jgi:hypothetical protein